MPYACFSIEVHNAVHVLCSMFKNMRTAKELRKPRCKELNRIVCLLTLNLTPLFVTFGADLCISEEFSIEVHNAVHKFRSSFMSMETTLQIHERRHDMRNNAVLNARSH